MRRRVCSRLGSGSGYRPEGSASHRGRGESTSPICLLPQPGGFEGLGMVTESVVYANSDTRKIPLAPASVSGRAWRTGRARAFGNSSVAAA